MRILVALVHDSGAGRLQFELVVAWRAVSLKFPAVYSELQKGNQKWWHPRVTSSLVPEHIHQRFPCKTYPDSAEGTPALSWSGQGGAWSGEVWKAVAHSRIPPGDVNVAVSPYNVFHFIGVAFKGYDNIPWWHVIVAGQWRALQITTLERHYTG